MCKRVRFIVTAPAKFERRVIEKFLQQIISATPLIQKLTKSLRSLSISLVKLHFYDKCGGKETNFLIFLVPLSNVSFMEQQSTERSRYIADAETIL